MLLSSLGLPTYGVVIIIAVVAVQYAFALFCLLKLAFLDVTKKEYVLWNLFILLVFFIGGIAFLIYYNKVKETKRIKPYKPEPPAEEHNADTEGPRAETTGEQTNDANDANEANDAESVEQEKGE